MNAVHSHTRARSITLLVLLPLILSAQDHTVPELDANRLQTGTFRYLILLAGTNVRRSRIDIRRSGSRFVFRNAVTGKFNQSWESVAAPDFSPVSAMLIAGKAHVFDLKYLEGRVSGSYRSSPIDETIAGGTVDQRIDWAAVMSFYDYRTGREYGFHVYDPGTGRSRVRVKIGESLEAVTTPAGRFQAILVTYQIEKNKGTEEYRVFMSRAAPHFMVREDFPDGRGYGTAWRRPLIRRSEGGTKLPQRVSPDRWDDGGA